MSEKWKLNEQELQKLLLVRRVVIAPLLGDKLEEAHETGKNPKFGREEENEEDHINHEVS
jgi:hypothetical protein